LRRGRICRNKAHMQISKCFLAVCAAACCTMVLPLKAADTDTDAKLREALRKKIAELQAQPAPAAAQPAPAPTPAAKAAPVAQPKPAAAKPAAAASQPVDQQSIDKARETLHKQMTELENQPPAATTASNVPPKTAASPAAQKTAAAPAAKPEAQAKGEKAVKKPATGTTALAPIQVPPPAISGDKQTRLKELLRQYKAEEITAEQYHQQRAKVLGEH
jgi:hypothetical protein